MPFRQCVVCKTSKRCSKLISCLHSLCVVCLQHNTQQNGVVKCPNCLKTTPFRPSGWLSLLQCLPNSVCGTSQEESQSILCEECYEDRAATAFCVDCGAHLCEAHVTNHSLSRPTRNHKLSSFADRQTDADDAGQDVRCCHSHPDQSVKQFCLDCDRLLCKTCFEEGGDAHGEHTVKPVADAAKTARDGLTAKLESCMSDSDGVISTAMEKVRQAIQAVHDQTESASEQAVEYYSTLMEAIKQRQQEVLDGLDQLRSKKLQPLESQLTRLERGHFRAESVTDILESSSDAVDMLLMRTWLDEAIESVKENVKSDTELCSVSALVFSPSETSDVLNNIRAAGCAVDVAGGSLKVGETATVGKDVEIEFMAGNDDTPIHLTPSQLSKINIDVQVTGPSDEAVLSPTPLLLYAGVPKAKFRPTQPGRHTVTASIQKIPLSCGPVAAEVKPADLFDRARCHADIQITGNGKTIHILPGSGTSFRSVCMEDIHSQSSKAEVRVKIGQTQRGHLFICLCSASTPKLDTYHRAKSEIFGWYGAPGCTNCNGGALGQHWQNGDIIHLCLDRDKRTLTGRHERTGTTEVLHNIQGTSFYWYISLFQESDRVSAI